MANAANDTLDALIDVTTGGLDLDEGEQPVIPEGVDDNDDSDIVDLPGMVENTGLTVADPGKPGGAVPLPPSPPLPTPPTQVAAAIPKMQPVPGAAAVQNSVPVPPPTTSGPALPVPPPPVNAAPAQTAPADPATLPTQQMPMPQTVKSPPPMATAPSTPVPVVAPPVDAVVDHEEDGDDGEFDDIEAMFEFDEAPQLSINLPSTQAPAVAQQQAVPTPAPAPTPVPAPATGPALPPPPPRVEAPTPPVAPAAPAAPAPAAPVAEQPVTQAATNGLGPLPGSQNLPPIDPQQDPVLYATREIIDYVKAYIDNEFRNMGISVLHNPGLAIEGNILHDAIKAARWTPGLLPSLPVETLLSYQVVLTAHQEYVASQASYWQSEYERLGKSLDEVLRHKRALPKYKADTKQESEDKAIAAEPQLRYMKNQYTLAHGMAIALRDQGVHMKQFEDGLKRSIDNAILEKRKGNPAVRA